jgi:hypothetical protein
VAALGTTGLIGGASGGGRGGSGPPGGCTAAPTPSLYTFNSAGLPLMLLGISSQDGS